MNRFRGESLFFFGMNQCHQVFDEEDQDRRGCIIQNFCLTCSYQSFSL